MRTNPRWISLVVAATLMGAARISAQDWQTVDDFAFAGGDAEAHGVAVDAAGRVYVVGTANGHGIVRYSADGGTNWSTRDNFLYPSQTDNNAFNAITINRQGDLFVGGASGGHWIVRRSTDQGVSWDTVDDFYLPFIDPDHPGTNGVVFSLSSDAQNRVYGAGPLNIPGPTYNRWWVRGSVIGGTNWDTKLVKFSGYGAVSQLACAGTDIYVIGWVSDSEVSAELILRSSDYGATWSTNFESTNEFPYAITSDSAGNVYAAGTRSISNSYDWLVRKAAPGATNWTILDQSSNEQTNGSPRSIAVDAAGNICVVGQNLDYYTYTNNGLTYYYSIWSWVTRQYLAASGQWSTTDLFTYSTTSTNMQTSATGTATAPDGSTFVVGYGATDSGQRRWVVRKRAAATPPPRLQIAVGNRILAVSWPATNTNFILQWTDSLGVNQLWQNFTGMVCIVDARNMATFDLTPGARFFRLKSAAGQ